MPSSAPTVSVPSFLSQMYLRQICLPSDMADLSACLRPQAPSGQRHGLLAHHCIPQSLAPFLRLNVPFSGAGGGCWCGSGLGWRLGGRRRVPGRLLMLTSWEWSARASECEQRCHICPIWCLPWGRRLQSEEDSPSHPRSLVAHPAWPHGGVVLISICLLENMAT